MHTSANNNNKKNLYSSHVFHSYILSCPREDKMAEKLADSCTWNNNKILCYHQKLVSGVQGKVIEEELHAAKFTE